MVAKLRQGSKKFSKNTNEHYPKPRKDNQKNVLN